MEGEALWTDMDDIRLVGVTGSLPTMECEHMTRVVAMRC